MRRRSAPEARERIRRCTAGSSGRGQGRAEAEASAEWRRGLSYGCQRVGSGRPTVCAARGAARPKRPLPGGGFLLQGTGSLPRPWFCPVPALFPLPPAPPCGSVLFQPLLPPTSGKWNDPGPWVVSTPTNFPVWACHRGGTGPRLILG